MATTISGRVSGTSLSLQWIRGVQDLKLSHALNSVHTKE